MFKSAVSHSTCLFVVVVIGSLGQRTTAQSIPIRVQQPLPGHSGPVTHPPQTHQLPCWQEAGVSKSAMQEREAIQRRTKSEVEAVCAETSLTPQQRQQKIQQIHQQAKQQMDALVSPQQLEAMKSCQMSRNHGGGHPGVGHPGAGGGHGPCGELPSGPHPPKTPNPSPGEKPEPENDN